MAIMGNSGTDIFLARQPIFDKDENIHGYELLYRSGCSNVFDGMPGDRATSTVFINAFQNIGIENITTGKPAFVNFTEKLILDELATLVPNHLLVVEILGGMKLDREIIKKCRNLKEMGYRIALDDYQGMQGDEPLLGLVDIVKVDFLLVGREGIRDVLTRLEGLPVKRLAEKVETREEFEYLRGLGFDYFQGYFFSKPEILTARRILPLKASHLQLIKLISRKGDLDFEKIEEVVARDLSLTYNLLKLVNSVVFGFRSKIKRIGQALVILGEKELKKWIYMMVLYELGQDRPDELSRLSLIRARFMELIAIETKYRNMSEDLFLAGFFSLLDVILKRPLEEILTEIKVSDLVRETLLNGGGELNDLYKMAICYEKGEWDRALAFAQKLDINSLLIAHSYIDALKWYSLLPL